MPRIPDKCKLLYGPYRAPALRRGDRTDCLMRGTVVITSWTAARISWPRCRRPLGKTHASLLVNDELARAVRIEAAAAVQWHGGVNPDGGLHTFAYDGNAPAAVLCAAAVALLAMDRCPVISSVAPSAAWRRSAPGFDCKD